MGNSNFTSDWRVKKGNYLLKEKKKEKKKENIDVVGA